MKKSNTLNILKNAFLMERQGKSLYEAVKHFFDNRATGEAQFKTIMQSGKFAAGIYEIDRTEYTFPAILSQDLKNKINTAGFKATAITAAVSFEQKSVKLYG
jgi:hypothetical protein